VGDCRTNTTAKIISAAAKRYSARHKQPVWTYSHGTSKVKRESWGNVSVLASCETTQQAKDAMARGYAAAIIVDQFDKDSLYEKDGIKILPCPEQTGKSRACTDCQLCFNDKQRLADGVVIGFTPHGSRQKAVRETLIQIAK
jgi:hypothetical protein